MSQKKILVVLLFVLVTIVAFFVFVLAFSKFSKSDVTTGESGFKYEDAKEVIPPPEFEATESSLESR